MKIKVVNKSDRRPRLKPRPLSKEFLFTGVFGLVIVAWWTYFGFEGKPLDLAWGMSFMIIFLIMIIASFRSVEIS